MRICFEKCFVKRFFGFMFTNHLPHYQLIMINVTYYELFGKTFNTQDTSANRQQEGGLDEGGVAEIRSE